MIADQAGGHVGAALIALVGQGHEAEAARCQ
jgi:hypothetical protein